MVVALLSAISFLAMSCSRPEPPTNIAVSPPQAVAAHGVIDFEAEPPSPQLDTDEDRLLHKVMSRLLATDLVREAYPKEFAWPPHYFVKRRSEKELNAYATAALQLGATIAPTGNVRPVVIITEGFMSNVVKGDENILAVIMGHEVAHLVRNHVSGRKGDTGLLALAFSRDDEIEADVDGMRFAVAAGFPYRAGIDSVLREMKVTPNLTSFEGLSSTHPTWEERLILLDREQAKLWIAMAGFRNGLLFLELEQYATAQQCFQAVTQEFPECYEAWANLGYAALMRYVDGMEPADLRNYDIGQVVAGGFYIRPQSLEGQVRGIDEKAWKDAVKALKRAVSLKPTLALATANLGLAYLVHPEGADAAAANKYYTEALAMFRQDPELSKNGLALSSVLVNAGVAELARGQTEATAAKFKVASELAQSLPFIPLVRCIEDALLYNRAMLLAKSASVDDKKKAFELLSDYLTLASPNAAWWTIAWERYSRLGNDLGLKVQAREALAKRAAPETLRLLTAVSTNGKTVALSEATADVVARLGRDAVVAIPLFPESKLVRYRFADQGIDVLGKERVLAIFLNSNKSPPIRIQAQGLGAQGQELRVGMTEKALNDLLKTQQVEKASQYITDRNVGYRFYPRLGLAVRAANGLVEELVLAQIPRANPIAAAPAVQPVEPVAPVENAQELRKQLDSEFFKGVDFYKQGRHADAVPYFEKAVKLAPKVFGSDHVNTSGIMNTLGASYRRLGKLENAAEMFKQSLAIREKLANDALISESLGNLAIVYEKLGRYAEAEPLYVRSLKIDQDKLGSNHPRTADALDNLGTFYHAVGRYSEAAARLNEAVKILESSQRSNQDSLARVLNNIGSLYNDMERFGDAGSPPSLWILSGSSAKAV